MMKLIPDGNRRLALFGGFAIGVAFAENVNAGTDDVESMYVGFFSIGGQGEATMLMYGEGLERIVRKFGSDHCLCYVGEKVGLEKIFALITRTRRSWRQGSQWIRLSDLCLVPFIWMSL